MFSVLFSNTQQTQKLFINILLKRSKKYNFGSNSLSNWVSALIRYIYTGIPNQNIRDIMVEVLEKHIQGIDQYLINIKNTKVYNGESQYFFHKEKYGDRRWIRFKGDFSHESHEVLLLEEIRNHINTVNHSILNNSS